jgi:polysaccharide export outer membrane protein
VTLGIGDVVSVAVFEAAAGGLFVPEKGSSQTGNFVEMPEQIVDNMGNITVPYAGAVKAAGRSIPSIQTEIEKRLADKAIQPQVIITLKEQRASVVSVLGDVNAAGRFPISPAGDRILDAIAKAGGPKYQGYETLVSLQRGSRQGTLSFAQVADDPTDNIFVKGGDIIIVSRSTPSFVTMGATGKDALVPFDGASLTLAEALGKSGGLIDERANPEAVYIYRMETRQRLTRLGYDTSWFASDLVPTIYAVNLRDPNGYFLASRFAVHDKDVIYIANAAAADVGKIFGVVRSGAVTAYTTRQVVN